MKPALRKQLLKKNTGKVHVWEAELKGEVYGRVTKIAK